MKKSPHEIDYRKPGRYFMVHEEDPDLYPIKVPIPPCPPFHSIDGYGLPPEQQKFTRPRLPQRLIKLQNDIGDLEAIDKEIKENYENYQEEIEFIHREWDRRRNGHWFFNNGLATYITGAHYFYISYWHIDVGIPDYRDRDRKWFCFMKFIVEEDPDCFGMVYPKHRREGATNKVEAWIYEYVSRTKNAMGGIQSATEKHAQDVFRKHMVPGWKKLPFFFKPKYEGTTNPKASISFNEPSVKITKGNMRADTGFYLGGYIDYKSSEVKGYDSRKLHRYHGDEAGKTTQIDINDRHGTIVECLAQGRNIIGKAAYTSTVEEMEKEGGKYFKKLCDNSHYEHHNKDYKRNKNGRTLSGMYILFIPAYQGLEGYVDEYGNDKEKEAKKFLDNTLQGFLDNNDDEGYAKFLRKFPQKYKDCWYGGGGECKFNARILQEQLDKYRFENKDVIRGRFEWVNGIFGTTVEFVPDKTGPFQVSHRLSPEKANKYRYVTDREKEPDGDDKFIAGSDPYRFKTIETQTKGSDGGGAVFMLRDYTIDTVDTPKENWKTNRFVCTYRHRPASLDDYCEDMLKMCVYYGCLMVPERNVDAVWQYFDRHGYSGYLWYEIDNITGRFKTSPGIYIGNNDMKEAIFSLYEKHIKNNGTREVHHVEGHHSLLKECMEIGDDMNPYDLFAAGGAALYGASFMQKDPPPPPKTKKEGEEEYNSMQEWFDID